MTLDQIASKLMFSLAVGIAYLAGAIGLVIAEVGDVFATQVDPGLVTVFVGAAIATSTGAFGWTIKMLMDARDGQAKTATDLAVTKAELESTRSELKALEERMDRWEN